MRIVVATNKDLEREVEEGRFRDDLYWRLNVLHIRIPPLRERSADIPVLAEHFLEVARASEGRDYPDRITPDAMAALTAYPWPGNVRELRNIIERVVTLALTEEIRLEDLPRRIRESGTTAVMIERASKERLSLREVERAYILEVLSGTGGNKSRAAEILGIDRTTLYRKLAEYEESEEPAPL